MAITITKYNIVLMILWLCVFVQLVLIGTMLLNAGFLAISFIAMLGAVSALLMAYEHNIAIPAKGAD